MPAEIIVLGPEEAPKDATFPGFFNVTSRSKDWTRVFSPFTMGSVVLYDDAPAYYARNVENCWQFSKVYREYLDENSNIKDEYWEWAKKGFECSNAIRYPKGKGAIPEFSYWDGERLGLVEARKKIYIPKYKEAMANVPQFQKLKQLYHELDKMFLWCYDGYNHKRLDMSYDDVIKNEERSMGHSFVVAMLLEEYI